MSLFHAVALGLFAGVGIGAEVLMHREDKKKLSDALRAAQDDEDDDDGSDDDADDEEEHVAKSVPRFKPSADLTLPKPTVNEWDKSVGNLAKTLADKGVSGWQDHLGSWEVYLKSGVSTEDARQIRYAMLLALTAQNTLDGHKTIYSGHTEGVPAVKSAACVVLEQAVRSCSITAKWQQEAGSLVERFKYFIGEAN